MDSGSIQMIFLQAMGYSTGAYLVRRQWQHATEEQRRRYGRIGVIGLAVMAVLWILIALGLAADIA